MSSFVVTVFDRCSDCSKSESLCPMSALGVKSVGENFTSNQIAIALKLINDRKLEVTKGYTDLGANNNTIECGSTIAIHGRLSIELR